MNKPLHKDPSFWIVAVVLVVAADVAQFYFGFPWFTEKIAAMRPAPRTPPGVQDPTAIRVDEQLDTSKKTYSWQVPRPESDLLSRTPPQVVIIPTEYSPPSGGWTTSRSNMAMGIRLPASFVVQSAYNWPSRSRVVWADPAPPGQFDYIANLPTGALEALQAEVKKQWGLVAERESRQTNVLVMKVHHADAPGLKPSTGSVEPRQGPAGMLRLPSAPMAVLVSILEATLRLPVIDQTAMTGTYTIQLPMLRPPAPGQTTNWIEQTRQVFIEQLGLDLVQTNAPVEMLVVKKAD
jgi:uncharacterized protein (TIGR03435 family)